MAVSCLFILYVFVFVFHIPLLVFGMCCMFSAAAACLCQLVKSEGLVVMCWSYAVSYLETVGFVALLGVNNG